MIEHQAARAQRAREREQQAVRDAELGDFMSAASVYTTAEVNIQQV